MDLLKNMTKSFVNYSIICLEEFVPRLISLGTNSLNKSTSYFMCYFCTAVHDFLFVVPCHLLVQRQRRAARAGRRGGRPGSRRGQQAGSLSQNKKHIFSKRNSPEPDQARESFLLKNSRRFLFAAPAARSARATSPPAVPAQPIACRIAGWSGGKRREEETGKFPVIGKKSRVG